MKSWMHRSVWVFLFATSWVSAGTVVLQDDFDNNSLDTSKWSINTNIPRGPAYVLEQNGRIEITNRGHLITKQQFEPLSLGGVHVTGQWTFLSSPDPYHDILATLTRSDGVPQGSYGETANGIEFMANQGGTIQIVSRVSGAATVLASKPINIRQGSTYSFDIRDNGFNLSFSLQEIGGSGATARVAAASALSYSNNRIAFHNREATMGGHTAYLDNVSVSAQPLPRTYAILVGSLADGKDANGQIFPDRIRGDLAIARVTERLSWATCQAVPFDYEGSGNVAGEIEAAADAVAAVARPQDSILFYYFGHGDTEGLSPVKGIHYSEQQLASLLGDRFPDQRKIVLLDSCHSGGFWNEGTPQGGLETLHNIAFAASATADTLAAAAGDGIGYWTTELLPVLDQLTTLEDLSKLHLTNVHEGDLVTGFFLDEGYGTIGWNPALHSSTDFDHTAGLDGVAVPEPNGLILLGILAACLGTTMRGRRVRGN